MNENREAMLKLAYDIGVALAKEAFDKEKMINSNIETASRQRQYLNPRAASSAAQAPRPQRPAAPPRPQVENMPIRQPAPPTKQPPARNTEYAGKGMSSPSSPSLGTGMAEKARQSILDRRRMQRKYL